MKATGWCSLQHCQILFNLINILAFQNTLAVRFTRGIGSRTGRYFLYVSYFIILLNATTFYTAIIKGMNCLRSLPVTAVEAFSIKLNFHPYSES